MDDNQWGIVDITGHKLVDRLTELIEDMQSNAKFERAMEILDKIEKAMDKEPY